MNILNIGSLNIDCVYGVDEFVKPAETIKSKSFNRFCGGKGLNQSVAVAKAGMQIFHSGIVGFDGDMLIDELNKNNVDTSLIKYSKNASGHAIIEVNGKGQNRIIVCGGSNMELTPDYIDDVLSKFNKNDILILQNEVSNLSYIIEHASLKEMYIVLNPSPITDDLLNAPLEKVNCFVLNEVEGAAISGDGSFSEILSNLTKKYKNADILLTVGDKGAYYGKNDEVIYCPAKKVELCDTTAAGDTFLGYFVACHAKGMSAPNALKYAVTAGGLAVSKKGASPSIPFWHEVESNL